MKSHYYYVLKFGDHYISQLWSGYDGIEECLTEDIYDAVIFDSKNDLKDNEDYIKKCFPSFTFTIMKVKYKFSMEEVGEA